MTLSEPYKPKSSDNNVLARDKKSKPDKLPGGISLESWQNRLGLAPAEVIMKTFNATIQLAMNVEVENRMIGQKHFKSRFPFLREKRLNDEFHSDTYYPSVLTNDGNTCSQMFISRNTDYMKVHLLKSESHSGQALQDFGQQVGIPRAIKADNAKAETG